MLTLRRATVEDAPLLRRWDAEPHVREATGGGDWQWESELPKSYPWRTQLIAEAAGVPIGFLEIVDPAEDVEHYWGTCRPTCAPSTSGSARQRISAAATASA